jgi:hypothetical protein
MWKGSKQLFCTVCLHAVGIVQGNGHVQATRGAKKHPKEGHGIQEPGYLVAIGDATPSGSHGRLLQPTTVPAPCLGLA